MKYIIALLLALVIAPVANARTQCKPAGMDYIHAFEQRPNWGIYWWCDYKTYDYTVMIVEDSTQQSIEQFWGWVMGVNPSWPDGPPKRDKDDPLMKSLSDAAFAFASADANRPSALPPEAWTVAKNGKYPDRPTYPVTNGKRVTKSDGRVDVGIACDCSTPIVEGKTTYCPRAVLAPTGLIAAVQPAPTSVAVCTQAAP